MTKQELIIAAYGPHWDKVKDFVDENGRLTYQQCWEIWGDGVKNRRNFYESAAQDEFLDLVNDRDDMVYYPRKLEGIVTNNGWNHIVSHGEVSPPESEEEVFYDVCDMESTDFQGSIVRRVSRVEVFALGPEYATHWRIHKEEPKPLH